MTMPMIKEGGGCDDLRIIVFWYLVSFQFSGLRLLQYRK
jgi:hypothetical protein